MLDQTIVETGTHSDHDVLAPGLLPVLQQAVALRLLLVLVSVGLLIWVGPPLRFVSGVAVNLYQIGTVIVIEAAALLALVSWPALRQRFGRWFLPLVLGWLLVAPVAQYAVVLTNAVSIGLLDIPRSFGGVAVESIWLLVPVVLAAWQYGRRGWLVAMGVLVAGQMILLPLLYLAGEEIRLTAVATVGRLGMIALLGYIVMRMGTALQAEHRALLRANQQLAQRAATTAQLAESRERNRLARELHDTLAHALTGLNVQLQAMDTLLDHDPTAVRQQLHAAQVTVRQGIQESRRAIQALRATPLEDLGLAEALRQLCRQQVERTGITLTCDIAGVTALDPLTEQAVYRIAESALANVEQHAAASTVTIRLRQSSDSPTLALHIRDDGIGFDRDQVADDRFGLSVMAERAQLVGATLRIQSAPGQGTAVSLEVP